MALNARQRQKKAEKKKAKEKDRKVQLRQRTQLIATREQVLAGSAPILHSYVTDTVWTEGLGHACIARELPNGQVAWGSFLVDMYCLGVKDAMFQIAPRSDYLEKYYNAVKSRYEVQAVEPAFVRKLVEGAVAYARDLGFAPHPDFLEAQRIFGSIDPAACDREFEYGRDGKPLFVQGPHDTPARCRRILETLSRHDHNFLVGQFSGGDDVLSLGGDFDDEDFEDDDRLA